MVPHHDLEALTDELIDQVLTANVRGPFATIRAFAPLLKASGDGVIVNISSGAAQRGSGSSIIYGASKAALDTMSMALARVLAPEVRVVVVAPGMVHTGFVPGRSEEMMLKAAMATPLKRQIEAEDVALAVLSCVTHRSATTGSIVNVKRRRPPLRSSQARHVTLPKRNSARSSTEGRLTARIDGTKAARLTRCSATGLDRRLCAAEGGAGTGARDPPALRAGGTPLGPCREQSS